MKCWIQKADYTADERDDVTLDEALRMFAECAWPAELANVDIDSGGKRDCTPGIGISNSMDLRKPASRLIHICPNDESTCFINHHVTSPRRTLWILPAWQVERNHKDFLMADVPDLIRLFFDNKEQELLNNRN